MKLEKDNRFLKEGLGFIQEEMNVGKCQGLLGLWLKIEGMRLPESHITVVVFLPVFVFLVKTRAPMHKTNNNEPSVY